MLLEFLAQADAPEPGLFGIAGFTTLKAISLAGSLATIVIGIATWFRVGDGPAVDDGRAEKREADQAADLQRSGPPRFNG